MILQGLVASIVFCAFLLAEIGSYALYLWPSQKWLWQFSREFGSELNPALYAADQYLSLGIAGNIVLFAVLAAAPVYALVRRKRLLLALNCHVAFFVFMGSVILSLRSGVGYQPVASSEAVVSVVRQSLDLQTIVAISVFAGLVVACSIAQRSLLRDMFKRG